MTLKNARVLVVDDDTDVLTAVRLLLKAEVREVITERNPETILQLLSRTDFDLVLLDMNFNSSINTGNEGLFWLTKIKSVEPTIVVVMVTAYGDIDLAVRSLKEGAADFMIKPWHNEKLLEAISEALSETKPSSEKKNTQAKDENGQQLLGDSDAMKDVFLKIEKIAPTDANVLILGENGTGKDLIAQAIHHKSLRKNKPFVKVDAGALTESLFESELFGHKKGAFTDARADRVGRFEAANGGTIFLDEIGNISLQQQAKLLSVLQNRQVIKLGSNEVVPIDIRLICATNMPLRELANEAKFRKDLIYRINTVELTVPPLRNRKQDIMLLSNHYAEVYGKKYLKSKPSFGKSAEEKLMSHGFPGNVRELQYIVERAVIMTDDNVLTSDDLIFSPIEKKEEITSSSNMKLSIIEKNTIINAIEKHQGNITQAAKELGLTRTALYRKLSKYNL